MIDKYWIHSITFEGDYVDEFSIILYKKYVFNMLLLTSPAFIYLFMNQYNGIF